MARQRVIPQEQADRLVARGKDQYGYHYEIRPLTNYLAHAFKATHGLYYGDGSGFGFSAVVIPNVIPEDV